MILPQGNRPILPSASVVPSPTACPRSSGMTIRQLVLHPAAVDSDPGRLRAEPPAGRDPGAADSAAARADPARAARTRPSCRARRARADRSRAARRTGAFARALVVQLELAEALLDEGNDTAGALDRVRRSRRLAVQGLVEARNAVAAFRSDEVPALPEALARTRPSNTRTDHGRRGRPHSRRASPDAGPGRDGRTAGCGSRGTHERWQSTPPDAASQSDRNGRRGLRLEVENPATIGALPGEKGFGLAGMRERLALVNGRLEAGPDGDAGWWSRRWPTNGARWPVVPDERAGGER